MKLIEVAFEQDFTKETSGEKIKHLLERLHATLTQFENKSQHMPINHDYLAVDIISIEKLLSAEESAMVNDLREFYREVQTTMDLYVMYEDTTPVKVKIARAYQQKTNTLLDQLERETKIYHKKRNETRGH